MRFAHIVNPVKVPVTSDLYKAQPITFESMLQAKKAAAGNVDVNLVSVQYAEDRSVVPESFIKTPDLSRSVLDVSSFEMNRKLPFIADILRTGATADPTVTCPALPVICAAARLAACRYAHRHWCR